MRCFLTLAMATATILSCSLVQETEAYAKYVKLVPNGDNISGYPAIGHPDAEGADGVNDFGTAFKAAGNAWTTALCQADSDGDGYTNGEELGDPCCTWTTTNTADLITTGVSHPGVKTLTPTNSALKAGCASSKAAASTASSSATTTATTSNSTAASGTSTDFTTASGSSSDVVGTVSTTESPSAATTDEDTVASATSTASSSSSSGSATLSSSDAKPLVTSVAATVLAAAVLAFAA